MNVLVTEFNDLAPLHRPILVLALRGLFDIAEVATDAVDTIIDQRVTTVIASIDPDVFYDFTQERPNVEFDNDGERHILWPENEFRLARFPGGAHDLVLLSGVEPHLRYATYAMLAGDTSILDERVLNGLKETYNSLGVPIGATVQSIQAMKEVTAGLVGPDAGREMGVYFDYICSGLG